MDVSQVMRGVYDYHTKAQGPLASNSNAGGTKLTTKDVCSWLHPHTAGPLRSILGEGDVVQMRLEGAQR